MEDADRDIRTIYWEALEHGHGEHGSDWYWSVGIIAIAAAVASFALGNALFGVIIILGASTLMILASRGPRTLGFTVGPRGIRINDELYPYSTLESFYLDEDAPGDTELLLKSKRFFMPLIVVPVPEEYVDTVDAFLNQRLPEEYLEEGALNKLFESFGF